jgi:hypothetical protein
MKVASMTAAGISHGLTSSAGAAATGGLEVPVHWLGTDTGDNESYGIAVSSSGSIFITGFTNSSLDGTITVSATNAIFLAKYDSSGTNNWVKLLGAATGDNEGHAVGVDTSGNAYVTGFTNRSLDGTTAVTATKAVFLTKYDSSGNNLWVKLLGASASDSESRGITVDATGSAYITGYTDSSLDGVTAVTASYAIFAARYDSSGNQQWVKMLGTAAGDNTSFFALMDTLANLYITGHTSGTDLDGQTSTGGTDSFIAKYLPDGTQW